MSHIIDIILVAVILLIVFVSSKKGLILTVFDLASGVVAFIAARFLAPTVASALYESAVKSIVVDFLTEKYTGIENTIAQSLSNITSVFDFLPDGVLTYAENAGLLDTASFSHSIMSSITTVEQLESSVVGPVVISLLNLVCFAVLSFVLLIVLRIAGRLISKLVSVTKIGDKLNSILGAVFGLLKGVVYVFIIAVIITVVACSSETVAAYAADSYICTFAKSLIGL